MKIGIDCRLAGTQHAGIGRYIENLIIRLPKLSPGTKWVYFFYDQDQAQTVLQKLTSAQQQNIHVKLAAIKHYSLAEQIQLVKIFHQAQLDLLHIPHFNAPIFYPGKLVITIHDLLWHQQKGLTVTTLPKWQYWLKYLAYRLVATTAIYRASKILVPAATIKKTLLSYYPQVKNKIIVTKEGVSQEFHLKPTQAHPLTKQLLYVGSLYPHKNIKLVLQALTQLPDYQLILVGARNVFQQQVKKQVKHLQLADQVKFTGYLSDAQLIKLYQQSLALIQPSLSEGFGLTGVEAMAAGVPVLASKIPIFQEIYQDAALYFNPYAVDELVQTIKQVSKTRLRKKLINQGQKLAQQYSWQQLTEQTWQSYQSVLNLKS
ncbi:MAG: glycosyltransferase [Candidatus Pacebacteria bacterium]|nr:glycosyltransferase [Candidatus Paceibacterota bacterium]